MSRPRGRPPKPLGELVTQPGRRPGREVHLTLDVELATDLDAEAAARHLPLSTVILTVLRERAARRARAAR